MLQGHEGSIMSTMLGQVAHVSVGRCVVSAHSCCPWHPEVRLRVLDEGHGMADHTGLTLRHRVIKPRCLQIPHFHVKKLSPREVQESPNSL